MPFNALSLIQAGTPTTFAERGGVVPFTTPALVGARIRRAARGGSELVVPNPSGRRGDYILNWDGLGALCRPTVHDTRLTERLRTLPEPTPYAVRDAAWDVAADGFAGPEARAAAEIARQADRVAHNRANTALLTLLVSQSTPNVTGFAKAALADLRAADLARRSRDGAETGSTGDGLAMAVSDLAALLAPIGIGKDAKAARLPRLLQQIDRTQDETLRFAIERHDGGGEHADIVAAAAAAVIGCARPLLDTGRGLTRDMAGLLRRWSAAPDVLAAELERAAWLLDGWEQIALLWSTARHPGERHEAIAQMTALLPVLPEEADAWLGDQAQIAAVTRLRKAVPLSPASHVSIAAFERVARNEDLRAQAA